MSSLPLEPWLDKRALAAHLACSVRKIEYLMHAGMPHAMLLGKAKFRVSEVEPWLEHTGRLQRRGEGADTLSTDESAARAAR